MITANCVICEQHMGSVTSTALVWHSDCYTPEAFDAKVLPKVNAYLESIRIPLAPIIREALITELVRRQMEMQGHAVFHDLAALHTRVVKEFDTLTGGENGDDERIDS